MQAILDLITEKLIFWYQKNLSKYKGYSCAHNYLHNEGTCSSWAITIVRSQGAISMLLQISERLNECKMAASELSSKDKEEGKSDAACAATEVACCFFSS